MLVFLLLQNRAGQLSRSIFAGRELEIQASQVPYSGVQLERQLLIILSHPEADSIAGRTTAYFDRTAGKTGHTFDGFIVWSPAKGYSADFTHYPWSLCVVANSRVQPHTALITFIPLGRRSHNLC